MTLRTHPGVFTIALDTRLEWLQGKEVMRDDGALVSSVAARVRGVLDHATAHDTRVLSRGQLHSRVDADPKLVNLALRDLAAGNSCFCWGDHFSLPVDMRVTQGGVPSPHPDQRVTLVLAETDEPLGVWRTSTRQLLAGADASKHPRTVFEVPTGPRRWISELERWMAENDYALEELAASTDHHLLTIKKIFEDHEANPRLGIYLDLVRAVGAKVAFAHDTTRPAFLRALQQRSHELGLTATELAKRTKRKRSDVLLLLSGRPDNPLLDLVDDIVVALGFAVSVKLLRQRPRGSRVFLDPEVEKRLCNLAEVRNCNRSLVVNEGVMLAWQKHQQQANGEVSLAIVKLEGSMEDPKQGKEVVRVRVAKGEQANRFATVLGRALEDWQGVSWDGELRRTKFLGLPAPKTPTVSDRIQELAKRRACNEEAIVVEAVQLLWDHAERAAQNPPKTLEDGLKLVGDRVGIFEVVEDETSERLGRMLHTETLEELWDRAIPSLRIGEVAVWNDQGGLASVYRGAPGALEAHLPKQGTGSRTARILARVLRDLGLAELIETEVGDEVACVREIAAEQEQPLPRDNAVAAALKMLQATSLGVYTDDSRFFIDRRSLDFITKRLD